MSSESSPNLSRLSKKLWGVGKIKKCEGCSCYVDTIQEFASVLDGHPEMADESIRSRVASLKEEHPLTHACLGCDPCYPVGISDALFEISDGKSVEGHVPLELTMAKVPCSGTACGCASAETEANEGAGPVSTDPTDWTVETGDYRLGDPQGCVAIATLASEELYLKFSEATCAESCAICGKVFTENIGIEKVLKNVLANPHIRFLVLCGREAQGHQTGACIKALHANGVGERGRIVEAPGKRPWIKTLNESDIRQFQLQVEIVDLIGCEAVETIEAATREAAARNPGTFDGQFIPKEIPRYKATPPPCLQLDKAGFLIVHPRRDADWIVVEHFRNTGEPTCIVEGSEPAEICSELIARGLVTQLDHAAYLGRELERAKLSIKLGFPFHQDRALGETETKEGW